MPKGIKSGLKEAINRLHSVKGMSILKLDQSDVTRHPLISKIIEHYEEENQMSTIDFSDHTSLIKDAWYKQIKDLLEFAKREEHIEGDAELPITSVDEQEIQGINRTYRNKDKVIDAASFASEEDEPGIDFSDLDIPRILGDIIICADVAQEQTNNYGHSFERELGFLALHGFLYLLGYDRMAEADEKETFDR